MALGFTGEGKPLFEEESLVTTRIKKKSLPEQPVTVPWGDILPDAEDGLWALSLRVELPQMTAAEVDPLAGPQDVMIRNAKRSGTEPKPAACFWGIGKSLSRILGCVPLRVRKKFR